jgi:protein bicaudal D
MTSNPQEEIDLLRKEVEKLRTELSEAQDERAKAAEYGLAVLEEKQALQEQYDELTTLYESTRRELEVTANGFKDIQSDYEKRLKEVEARESNLLQELESRETTLVSKTSTLEDDVHRYNKQVKQFKSENDHLNDLNAQIMVKLEKHMRNEERLQEKIRSLEEMASKEKLSNADLSKDIDKLREKMNLKGNVEKSNESLRYTIEVLKGELEEVHHKLHLMEDEKEELVSKIQDTTEALNLEREAKSILEERLHDLPPGPRIAFETGTSTSVSLLQDISLSDRSGDNSRENSFPSYSPHLQASPQQPRTVKGNHSLFEELQSSVDDSELKQLKEEVESYKEKLSSVQKERDSLLKRVDDLSRIQIAAQQGEAVDGEITGLLRKVRNLEEAVATKEEMVNQMRRKVEESSMKNAQLESDVYQLKSSLEEAKKLMAVEVGEKKEEVSNKEKELAALQTSVENLRRQLSQKDKVCHKLESVILSTEKESALLSSELKKFVISIRNAQVSKSALRKESDRVVTPEPPASAHEPKSHLKLTETSSQVVVHSDRNCLLSLVTAKELVHSLREPLESFKKALLEASISASRAPGTQMVDKADQEETEYGKLAKQLKAKTEEVENLKIILRARTATQEVVISQLKSKLESETKANQSKQFQLSCENRRQGNKIREQQNALYAHQSTISDFSSKLQEIRKEYHRLKNDKEEIEIYLNATIRKKIELSEKLEEYEIEKERHYHIPHNLASSRV